MECPKCHQSVEPGAAFCGNCGQALQVSQSAIPPPPAPPPAPISPIAQVISAPPQPTPQPVIGTPVVAAGGAVPGYALATPAQHAGETKALLSLLLGIVGIIGALFIPLVGLIFGITGIVLGTMSRSGSKRGLSTAGLIFSSLAVLAGLAMWTYAIKHNMQVAKSSSNHDITAPAIASSQISTPCYSAGFTSKLNVSNSSDSCDMKAFNGTTMDSSTDAYKVYADTSQIINASNYASLFKPALEKDISTNLPDFTTDSETATLFAGSPAYIITGSNRAHGVAIVEAAVYHQVKSGANVFILVHAINGRSADLNNLEAEWQWK